MSYNFPVTRTANPKPKPDQSNLGFGKYFTDHMFIMDYDEGRAGTTARSSPMGLSAWIRPPVCSTTPR